MIEQAGAPAWPRPYWQPSEETAVLQFYVFGKFDQDLVIPSARYGSPGLPAGVTLERFQNLALRSWEGYPLKGALGELLKEDDPATFEEARIAPEVLVVRGTLADSDRLDYLRDTLGVLAALLDVGGTSVLDPQILSLFDGAAWRQHYLIEGGAPPRHHVLILRTADEASDHSRVRTRGMRKFGRPDLDLHNVPVRDVDRAGALCEQLVELQSLGAAFATGQLLDVDGVPGELVAECGGSMDDPQFNNTHVAFHWPD